MMKLEEAKVAFLKEVEEVSQMQMEKLQQYMGKHYNDLKQQFMSCFDIYCQKIIKMQESVNKNPLSYIQFSMMRTKLIEGIYEFRIDAYDQELYLDSQPCVGIYDVTPIFAFLEKFSDLLTDRRRKYVYKITLGEVKQFVLEESEKYKSVVVKFIRSILPYAAKSPTYEGIMRSDLFMISVGEFRDMGELVYKEDRTIKDAEKVRYQLEKHKEKGHNHEVFENLDLSGGDFAQARWFYCSGSESQFTNVSFENSALLFCPFQNATFNQATFVGSNLLGINFAGATFVDVKLKGARLIQVNFENARLENIDFTEAEQIVGLNLTNATLINVKLPEKVGVE